MAGINVSPEQGPFSGALVPQQPDPQRSNTGYQNKAAGTLGIIGKFLEGITQGRVAKYAKQEQEANKTFQVLGAHVQNYMSDPNIDPALKSQVGQQYFDITSKAMLHQLGESTKGKDSKESTGGKLAHGAKSLLEAFTGGKLKPEMPDVGSITKLLDVMQQGTKPENQVQPQVDEAMAQMRAAAKELGPNPTQGQLQRHEGFQKATGRLQALAPDRADKLIKQFVEGYDKAPARGSKESVVDAAMSGADSGSGKTPSPPSRSGQMPTVMRKDQPAAEPGVATGDAAGKLSNKQLLMDKEMGLVEESQVRSYGGKPVRVFAVKGKGTYSIDGKLMDGPGEEYKAPTAPHYFSTTGKDGQIKYWVSDPLKPETAKPVTQNGQPLTGEKAKTSKTIWKTDASGKRTLQAFDPDTNTWSPSKDPHGQDIVDYSSQSKEWQRQHEQIHREIKTEYDKYVTEDAALEKEAAAGIRSIDNAKGAGGNPLTDQEKQQRKAELAKNITDRRKRAKQQTEMMIQGIAGSAGLPWRAFADTDQLDHADQVDAELGSGDAWSDSDVSTIFEK